MAPAETKTSDNRPQYSSALLLGENLAKAYHGRRVVDGVTIHINAGEIVGLLGPNGAGKTTTFNIIAGLIRPEAGRVMFENKDITKLPMHKRARLGIGYLTQEPSIFRKLTVEENIMAVLEVCDLTKQEREARLRHLLEELELTDLAKRKAYTLSGGEKRRLEITRALVTNPKLLLLDEPFSGIDPITVYEVQKIIRRLKARNIAILITDHRAQETLRLVDRAYLIAHGKILYEGDAQAMLSDPKAREIYLGPEFTI